MTSSSGTGWACEVARAGTQPRAAEGLVHEGQSVPKGRAGCSRRGQRFPGAGVLPLVHHADLFCWAQARPRADVTAQLSFWSPSSPSPAAPYSLAGTTLAHHWLPLQDALWNSLPLRVCMCQPCGLMRHLGLPATYQGAPTLSHSGTFLLSFQVTSLTEILRHWTKVGDVLGKRLVLQGALNSSHRPRTLSWGGCPKWRGGRAVSPAEPASLSW